MALTLLVVFSSDWSEYLKQFLQPKLLGTQIN